MGMSMECLADIVGSMTKNVSENGGLSSPISPIFWRHDDCKRFSTGVDH